MEFEHQKAVSDAYRANWERLYGEKTRRDYADLLRMGLIPEQFATYRSGCPILGDDQK